MPVILPMHPRTMKVVTESGLRSDVPSSVHVTPPLGYFESVACVRDARVVVTDSGGVQREAYWLGTPCVTLRTETEWEETIECGANVIVRPADVDQLPDVTARHAARSRDWNRDLLGTGHAAELVAAGVGDFILEYGNAR
jgi:UDP-N-acetylglucosamine 2-epimerase